jgi:hypothetical protein
VARSAPIALGLTRIRYRVDVSVWETVLVFVVLPLGALGVLALLVFAPSMSRTPRYRPGRPWNYDPVWYIPHPEVVHPVPAPSVGAGVRPAVTAGQPPASVLDAPVRTARGGASGEW